MNIYAFCQNDPVIFDSDDISEIFAFEDYILVTLKDYTDYECSTHMSVYPELLEGYDLEKAIKIWMRGDDKFTGNAKLFEVLKKLRREE